MDIKKLYWAFRLILKKPWFKKIGWLSYMGQEVSLSGANRITIGNKVRIYPGCRMETYDGGEIVIGDGCSIGQNFHITSGYYSLFIGKNTTISGNVFITNIDHEYRNIGQHILQQPMLFRDTVIGENCFVGYGAAIQAGTKLGKQCIVGANSVVRGEFPNYSVIVGVPAKVVKQYDEASGEWKRA